MVKKVFKYIGSDSWRRPVYEGPDGTLLVDVDPVADKPMKLCTKLNNVFDAEPDTPVEYASRFRDVEVEIDRRVVW